MSAVRNARRRILLDCRMSPRTRKPSPEDRAFVRELVHRLGVHKAAEALKLSRLATLSVATGGDCYPSTLDQVTSCRVAARA